MPFAITRAETAGVPTSDAVDAALKPFAIGTTELADSLGRYVCPDPPAPDYQTRLAAGLEAGFRRWLVNGPGGTVADRGYSPNLREVADVVVSHPAAAGRIFVEIEFRPNFEKDLVKFQIGANVGRPQVAVLVVALAFAGINPSYHIMPEYAKVLRTVRELRPQ